MKWLVAGLTAAALVLAGCGDYVGGDAKTGSRAGDPAFFFAGDVPSYGQTVSNNDKIVLAYLRAIRRIDPCGFADRQALAKIGEIASVGTLYALDECDIEVKMPNDAAGRFVSLQLTMSRVRQPPAFRAGGVSIYETAKDSCEFMIPVELSRLPDAQPLRKPDQPYLRLGLIGVQDCAVTKKVASAIAERITAGPLPPRDGAAAYPVPLWPNATPVRCCQCSAPRSTTGTSTAPSPISASSVSGEMATPMCCRCGWPLSRRSSISLRPVSNIGSAAA